MKTTRRYFDPEDPEESPKNHEHGSDRNIWNRRGILIITSCSSYSGSFRWRRTSTKGKVRALLEANLVTVRLAGRLGDGLERIQIGVAGVSGSPMDSTRLRTHIYLQPANAIEKNRGGLQNIGIINPSVRVRCDVNEMERNLILTDLEFSFPRGIYIDLGANIYGQVVLLGVLYQAGLFVQSTIFGWVLTASLPASGTHPMQTITAYSTLSDDNDLCHERLVGLLQRFWAMEDVPKVT